MSAFATIGIYNDFATSKAGVSVRAANYKFTCRVDMISNAVVEQSLDSRAQFGLYSWNDNLDDVFLDFGKHFSFRCKVVVLGRYNNGIDALRHVVV